MVIFDIAAALDDRLYPPWAFTLARPGLAVWAAILWLGGAVGTKENRLHGKSHNSGFGAQFLQSFFSALLHQSFDLLSGFFELFIAKLLEFHCVMSFGGLKMATMEGKGADCLPSPNFTRPRTNRISAARW